MSRGFLVDTNILIDVIRGKHNRQSLLEGLVAGGGSLACSVITVAELYSRMRPHEKAATEGLLDSMEVLEIDHQIAREGGMLRNEGAMRGVTLDVPDTLIAATAITRGLTLVTTNVKDFPMPGLRLFPVS